MTREVLLSLNPGFRDRSKHIGTPYHFTRDLIKEQRIHREYVPTKDMLADLLTMSLSRAQHEHFLKASVYSSSLYVNSACSEGVC